MVPPFLEAWEVLGGIDKQFDQLAANFGIDPVRVGGDLGPGYEQPVDFDDVADQLSCLIHYIKNYFS